MMPKISGIYCRQYYPKLIPIYAIIVVKPNIAASRFIDRRQSMPERNGYKTIDLVAQQLGMSEDKVRVALTALEIQPIVFPDNRRPRYYSPEDIEKIARWLRGER